MSYISTTLLIDQFKTLLHEGINGPQKDWSYFTDPNSTGFIGTNETLSSSAASKTSGPHDNSVAAHAWHLRFALRAACEWIHGDHSSKNWEESRKIQEVDDDEWVKIKSKLREEYENFFRLIEAADLSNKEILTGIIGTIAHVAYHLGTIRQKLSKNDLQIR